MQMILRALVSLLMENSGIINRQAELSINLWVEQSGTEMIMVLSISLILDTIQRILWRRNYQNGQWAQWKYRITSRI
jgi:hypothetical protein